MDIDQTIKGIRDIFVQTIKGIRDTWVKFRDMPNTMLFLILGILAIFILGIWDLFQIF